MKANDKQTFPADDPRSLLSWDKIVNVHRVSCQHGNHLLLPWHRLYLQYFEQACRFALQALYGHGEPSLIPGIIPIQPQDVLDCILLHKKANALIIDTWTV